MTIAQQLALWADQLRDLSAVGLRYAKDNYNTVRYRTIQDMAMAMLALATGESIDRMEALRAPVFSRPTPLSSGDAAIIDDQGRILLIRRADNQCWAMPGGALEVGETPAQGVVREALEETGLRCEAVALVGVFDSRHCGTVSRHHLYHFLFLCRPLSDHRLEAATHAHEVLDVGWFAEDDLPAQIDPGHISRIPEAFRLWHGDGQAFFDVP